MTESTEIAENHDSGKMDFSEHAVQTLTKMLQMLDMESTVTLAEGENKLLVASEDAGRLIGKRGQTLECLELILNRIVSNMEEKGRVPWFTIDVDGYCVEAPVKDAEHHGRLPREEISRLEALAKDIAKEVKKLGKPRIIGPYSPAERRIIHVTLEKDPDVETISDAEADQNRGKKITICLRQGAN